MTFGFRLYTDTYRHEGHVLWCWRFFSLKEFTEMIFSRWKIIEFEKLMDEKFDVNRGVNGI